MFSRERSQMKLKIMRVQEELLLVLICIECLMVSSAKCPAEIGCPLDLNRFAGEWFFIAGTPVNGKSLSKCGRFAVKKTSGSTFEIKYTALSRRDNSPVTFNVNGRVGTNILGNWQLEGSKRILGPFEHVILSADYNSALAMVVCSENNSSYRPGHKFSMIWSRERSLPPTILEKLKAKLAGYIDQDILMADQTGC